MAVNMRFAGTVTNNGVPVEGTAKVSSTTTTAGVSGPVSTVGRFSIVVSVSDGDTITLALDTGQTFSGTTVLQKTIANAVVDLSCDIGSGAMSAFERFS